MTVRAHLGAEVDLVISNCDDLYALDENVFSIPWNWALPQDQAL